MSDDIYNRALARANERLDEEIAREGFPPAAQFLVAMGVAEGFHAAEREIARLRRILLDGPASQRECAEFCKAASLDGDGRPCLDCTA